MAYHRDMSKAYLAYQKYEGRLVSWEGRVRKINELVSPWAHDCGSIVTDMFPSDVYAYVLLLFNHTMNEQVATLLPGDYMRFNATLFEWGRRGLPYALVLRDVQEVDAEELDEHANATHALHNLAMRLQSSQTLGLRDAELEAMLEKDTADLIDLIKKYPREFPELTSPAVIAARFPSLADALQAHIED